MHCMRYNSFSIEFCVLRWEVGLVSLCCEYSVLIFAAWWVYSSTVLRFRLSLFYPSHGLSMPPHETLFFDLVSCVKLCTCRTLRWSFESAIWSFETPFSSLKNNLCLNCSKRRRWMHLIENGDETDGGSCWALKCWSSAFCVVKRVWSDCDHSTYAITAASIW